MHWDGLEKNNQGAIVHQYFMNDSFHNFQAKLAKVGGRAVLSHEKNWLATTDAIFTHMRESIVLG